jgi:hypothetical protein
MKISNCHFYEQNLWDGLLVVRQENQCSHNGTTGSVSQHRGLGCEAVNIVAQSHIRKEPVDEEVYQVRGA